MLQASGSRDVHGWTEENPLTLALLPKAVFLWLISTDFLPGDADEAGGFEADALLQGLGEGWRSRCEGTRLVPRGRPVCSRWGREGSASFTDWLVRASLPLEWWLGTMGMSRPNTEHGFNLSARNVLAERRDSLEKLTGKGLHDAQDWAITYNATQFVHCTCGRLHRRIKHERKRNRCLRRSDSTA